MFSYHSEVQALNEPFKDNQHCRQRSHQYHRNEVSVLVYLTCVIEVKHKQQSVGGEESIWSNLSEVQHWKKNKKVLFYFFYILIKPVQEKM